MKYQGIESFQSTWLDYPDTESQALEVYLGGCNHNCPSCQNKELQAIKELKFSFEEMSNQVIKEAKRIRTNKIVFVGGEPLLKSNNNLYFIKDFLSRVQGYDVIIYTGYEISQVINNSITGFTFVKTGKYIESLKQESLKTEKKMQLASTNQKLFDRGLNLISNKGILYFKENNN